MFPVVVSSVSPPFIFITSFIQSHNSSGAPPHREAAMGARRTEKFGLNKLNGFPGFAPTSLRLPSSINIRPHDGFNRSAPNSQRSEC